VAVVNHNVKSNERDSDSEDGSIKRPRNSKLTKDITLAGPGKSESGKSKKRTVVEVVILSPKKGKRTETGGDDKPQKRRGKKRVVSSDEDDELLLAPQSNPPAVAKSHKGKKRVTKLRTEGIGPSTEVEPSSESMVMSGEEPHEQRSGATPIPHADGHDESVSVEPTTATPSKVGLNAFS